MGRQIWRGSIDRETKFPQSKRIFRESGCVARGEVQTNLRGYVHPRHIQDMFEFHHDYMLSMYREKVMYTDTDSLIYHIECDDVYEIMKRDISRFETSNHAIDNVYNVYGIPLANKKVGLNERREQWYDHE